jgi:predicted ATPase/transcriptional regulator with XRE-family HTH domain
MVRRHRRALGLTQEELAERAGLSDRAIRQIERRDEHIPRKETVILLADALDLTGTEREAFQHAARRVGEIEHVDRVTPHESRARLPDERTSFIGREREIADVVALLSRPTVRLVTLTGPGGSGKTRLALQAATRLRPHFVDGVYFVSLASLSDSRLVPTVVAIELGFGDGGDAASSDALQAWLSEKHLLLVLDNFEHLLDASPMLQTLIEAAPGLCILVTSRTSLRLSPEYEYLVPPLSVPERRGVTSADTLLQYESVALFVDRAQAVRPGFTLDRENAPAVGEICSRLDGLPLAIELAAVRIRLFPPQALLGLLSSPLRILTGGPRDLPARQQTLRNTIEWSYRLLSEVEQTLFARLSVFAESWTLEAADAVCNAEGDLAMDPLDGMTSLTEKSLVISAENEGPPRFVMLETIREYAAERLQASAEYASLRQHHALYYVSLVETAEPQLRGAEEIRWFDQLLDERHNLRAALIWAREHEQVELGLRLAVALSMFWAVQGYLAEGRAWLDEFLARSNTDGRHRTAVSPHVHNRAINAAAYLAWVQGDAGAAIPLYEQSLSLSRQLGDRRITAEALLYLGCMSLDTHRVQRVSLLEESLSLAREIGAVELLHHVLFYLGRVAQTEGAIDRARSLYRESLTAARALGSQHELGCLLVWQAQALQLLGDDERARLLFEEGAAIARAAGDGAGAAAQLNSLALQARNQGDYEHATKILEEGPCNKICEMTGVSAGSFHYWAFWLRSKGTTSEPQPYTRRV